MNGRWPSNFLLTHNPGCEKIGAKRVKSESYRPKSGHGAGKRVSSIAMQGDINSRSHFSGNNYADSDGLETIDDWRCTENCPVRRLGGQSSVSKSSGGGGATRYGSQNRSNEDTIVYPDNVGYGDKGTAARFFFQADWYYERIEAEELWDRSRKSQP